MKLFNLSPDQVEHLSQRKTRSLIIYDISCNKRRSQLSKLLEGLGVRVQRSCFEVYLTKREHRRMLDKLHNFYQADTTDNLIIYEKLSESIIRLNHEKVEFDRELICL